MSSAASKTSCSAIGSGVEPELAGRDPRHVEQIVHEPHHLADLAFEAFALVGDRVRVVAAQADDFQGVEDRRQRVAEFVAQRGQELVLVGGPPRAGASFALPSSSVRSAPFVRAPPRPAAAPGSSGWSVPRSPRQPGLFQIVVGPGIESFEVGAVLALTGQEDDRPEAASRATSPRATARCRCGHPDGSRASRRRAFAMQMAFKPRFVVARPNRACSGRPDRSPVRGSGSSRPGRRR